MFHALVPLPAAQNQQAAKAEKYQGQVLCNAGRNLVLQKGDQEADAEAGPDQPPKAHPRARWRSEAGIGPRSPLHALHYPRRSCLRKAAVSRGRSPVKLRIFASSYSGSRDSPAPQWSSLWSDPQVRPPLSLGLIQSIASTRANDILTP